MPPPIRFLTIIVAAVCAVASGWLGGSRLVADQSQALGAAGAVPFAGAQRGQPSAAIGTAFLAGQVVDHLSGSGVPRASVLLLGRGGPGPAGGRGGGNPWAVYADSQGRFFFANLPPGAYTLQVTKAGYSAAAPASQARVIDLAEAERISDLKIQLSKLAVLGGTIRDETGEPVTGTDVWALRRTLVNGPRTLTRSGTSRSDDHGAYRIPGLPAGDYLVCACIRDPLPLDGVLLTTLAADPLQLMSVAASPITLTAGDERQNVDFRLELHDRDVSC
jgi:Carboxypeptidase regulatory-like domain